jgi:ethanolamine utilization cobalamin adenosyltransferase
LYLARTKPEQKIGQPQADSFFTSHPVDIHELVHSRARFFGHSHVFPGFPASRADSPVVDVRSRWLV